MKSHKYPAKQRGCKADRYFLTAGKLVMALFIFIILVSDAVMYFNLFSGGNKKQVIFMK